MSPIAMLIILLSSLVSMADGTTYLAWSAELVSAITEGEMLIFIRFLIFDRIIEWYARAN